MNILDWLIALSGVYMVYTAILMKVKGRIVKSVVISQDVDIEHIRDKEGFIRYMWGKVLGMGLMAIVVGAVGIVGTRLGASLAIYLISFLGYFVLLIWLGVISVRARKKFID